MTEVTDLISTTELDRIKDRLDQAEENQGFGETVILGCREIQPTGTQYIGAGDNRCVFKKDNKVLKVARRRDGRIENRGARQVMENVSRENEDAFIVPEDIDQSDTVLVAEEADHVPDTPYVAPGQEDFFNAVDQKLRDVYQEDGIHCNDWAMDDIGTLNGEPVLTDLGGCSSKE